MEEGAEIRECGDVGTRAASFHAEIHRPSTIGQQQMVQTDSVLKSLSPLLNSMRPFGLYFARKPRIHCHTMAWQSDRRVGRCGDCSCARVHATVLLVVTWLNAIRYSAVFDGKETPGATLFLKLGMIPTALLNIAFQTAYYVAVHRGTLDRVIRQADLSTAELCPKYRRLTTVVTVVCWLLVAWIYLHYVYQLFFTTRVEHLTPLGFQLSRIVPEIYLYVIKAVLAVLHLLSTAALVFPQAMRSAVLSPYFVTLVFVYFFDSFYL